jgi:adenosylmethionine-8-amino-7-oxononanoate aminotransferase
MNILYGNFKSPYPVLVSGEGVYVFDEQGRKYLDAASGVCVVNIGHGVEEIITAMAEQARRLTYAYGGEVDNLPRRQMAARLGEWMPAGMGETKVFLCSGGAEANESALKLAYQVQCERGKPTRHKVISRWQSYHGNTIGALSMSGRTSWRGRYAPYLLDFPHIPPPYCYRCPFGMEYPGCGMRCAHELERVIQQEGPDNISAFIAEPVIGSSISAVVPPPEYYPLIREICDQYDVLFIADEVMSGVGRTGKKWAIEHWGVTPDILTCAKGIGGGYVPLAASVLAEKTWKAITEGSRVTHHSFTYGGHPVCSAAGIAVLDYIDAHHLVEQAASRGEVLMRRLHENLDDLPWVGDVRGKGLFAGVELVQDKKSKEPFPVEAQVMNRVKREVFENGVMLLAGAPGSINGVMGDTIEIVPPYTISEEQIDFLCKTLRAGIVKVLKG